MPAFQSPVAIATQALPTKLKQAFPETKFSFKSSVAGHLGLGGGERVDFFFLILLIRLVTIAGSFAAVV